MPPLVLIVRVRPVGTAMRQNFVLPDAPAMPVTGVPLVRYGSPPVVELYVPVSVRPE